MKKKRNLKQTISQEDFLRIRDDAIRTISRGEIDDAIGRAVARVREQIALHPGPWGYCWSAGKDSQALRLVAEAAGVRLCAMGMTNLEWPKFLAWVTENMPDGLVVYNTRQDIPWLEAHPEQLFPQSANASMVWFRSVQHRAQALFFKEHGLAVLLLGRRLSDGNYCGTDGAYSNREGILRVSPLADWSHEYVFAAVHHYALGLPPIYDWPRGYRVGTHSWPMRQWCPSIRDGFLESMEIDPAVIIDAARRGLSAARAFLENERIPF